MSSGIWISTAFLPGWLLRRAGLSAGTLRAPSPAPRAAFAGAGVRAGVGCATAAGAIGLGAGVSVAGSSSKMPAKADGFFAITLPR
ncbi:hypothetical protein [Sphingobium sp. B2]|uniref:hypothetical protein n=1 Tax=Sphingobium sp. B2 TaxID=2583228 RepID=UPI001643BDA4|nr:hypothetical protein [Sphingobium sp. B2]